MCGNGDGVGSFDDIAGVEVADLCELPAGFSHIHLPARPYAVFTHQEHISVIRNTVHTIWSHWLPQSGHEVAQAPDFERYDERFDPRTGLGGVEIWVPTTA